MTRSRPASVTFGNHLSRNSCRHGECIMDKLLPAGTRLTSADAGSIIETSTSHRQRRITIRQAGDAAWGRNFQAKKPRRAESARRGWNGEIFDSKAIVLGNADACQGPSWEFWGSKINAAKPAKNPIK